MVNGQCWFCSFGTALPGLILCGLRNPQVRQKMMDVGVSCRLQRSHSPQPSDSEIASPHCYLGVVDQGNFPIGRDLPKQSRRLQ